jgi:hypothetical protein
MAPRRKSQQTLSDKTLALAADAGSAIGQAALQMTHRAIKGARKAVISADRAIRPAKKRSTIAAIGGRKTGRKPVRAVKKTSARRRG